jgi:D-aminopeptidase
VSFIRFVVFARQLLFQASTLPDPETASSNDDMSPLLMVAIQATENAIINSLFQAKTMTGRIITR